MIAQEGYTGASLRKVAQRAGCTTGAVTYYFANKRELVVALAESRFDGYDAMLEEVRARADATALFELWLARTADAGFWPVMSQLLVHARHEPALAAVIERRYARYRSVYASIIARGQRRGSIRDDIPADLLADQLSSIGDGWMRSRGALTTLRCSARFSPLRGVGGHGRGGQGPVGIGGFMAAGHLHRACQDGPRPAPTPKEQGLEGTPERPFPREEALASCRLEWAGVSSSTSARSGAAR
ncbi:AcrR family transcriptional regulator [Nocardiopsis composta]|uniref:AcrR family transcriptional regulator n=1 Tax=Nocardiopsis composta TaxID=157465 RepID=A0A7W8VG42_9ACTN|nr:AcrR family transcriptional regulator [Nocardiopsis composta]